MGRPGVGLLEAGLDWKLGESGRCPRQPIWRPGPYSEEISEIGSARNLEIFGRSMKERRPPGEIGRRSLDCPF